MFLVKFLNIISVEKKEICTYFTRKNSKVELHSSKTIFWLPSSNFANFFGKMSATFESGQNILYLET